MSNVPPLRPDRMQVIVDLPAESVAAATNFWAAALGWPAGEPWTDHPEFVTFEPAHGTAYVSRQQVDGPAGIHLDLEMADLDQGVDQLTAMGATAVRATDQWRTLTSPGGLAFCLVRTPSNAVRPAATTWATGHRSRLMQVCIDSPPALHEREVRFWRYATGWRWESGASPEFAGKLHPAPGSPVQLLLHRLGEDDGGETVRAHLDLGTDDLQLEAQRLTDAGATRLWDGRGWITLRDPAGMLFCATSNAPYAP